MKREIVFLVLVAGLLTCLSTAYGRNAFAEGPVQAQTGATVVPTYYEPNWLSEPPALTNQQKAALSALADKYNLPGPATPQAGTIRGPLSGTETGTPGNGLQVPGTFAIRRNADLSSIVPTGYASHVLEPSVANEGMFVFYTANWFAARSINGGPTGGWTYINPYADFASFCCDQDVIYDPARREIIWFRQGVSDVNGNNTVKIQVSTNGGSTFCNYDITPSGTFGWTNQQFDYPHLALSNNNLYVATNVFDVNNLWQRTVIFRMDLDTMSTCGAITPSYVAVTDHFNFTPVQGARHTMYWASHNSTSSMRVYSWDDASGSYAWNDITVDAWTSTPRGSAVCTTPDSYNPCARFDDRILSGWIANWAGYPGERVIGFFWNVKQDGVTFLYPYVNAAVFKESDKTYISRPYIYSSSGAFIYGVGAPNARGDLGVSFFFAGGGNYPTHGVAIDDDYDAAAPPGWEVSYTNTSSVGPSDNKWGDYVRVRPHSPAGLQWTATGYYLDGTGTSIPKYIIFGRERDNKSLNRWLLN